MARWTPMQVAPQSRTRFRSYSSSIPTQICSIERFVAVDVFQHYWLDIGKTIQDKAPNAKTGLKRLKEVKEYVKEAIAARFRALRAARQTLSGGRVKQFVQAVLQETFQVFEHYT
jgi:hypothetical protein